MGNLKVRTVLRYLLNFALVALIFFGIVSLLKQRNLETNPNAPIVLNDPNWELPAQASAATVMPSAVPAPTNTVQPAISIPLSAPTVATSTPLPVASPTPTRPTVTPSPTLDTSVVDALIAKMSVEDRVGQLFVIRFSGQYTNKTVEDLITAVRPGGVILMPDNLDTPKQITELTNSLQGFATKQGYRLPLLIMTDQEGGTVQRVRKGMTRLPAPLLLGAISDHTILVNYGRVMGRELAAVGINMDLAPVVDLATSPNNPVLFDRTMSDSPELVRSAAAALVAGMREAGVIAVLKHFPGHGDVADTHLDSARLVYSEDRLSSREILAFTDTDAPVVMLGHISVPALDPSDLPATLSEPIINYLRSHVKHDGVVMTDAMDMGAIGNHYNFEDAVIRAVKAGEDMVLLGAYTPTNKQIAAYRAVLDAVRRGEISEARLNASVKRILLLKQRYRLLTWSALLVDQVDARIDLGASRQTIEAAYRTALTVVKNDNNLLPFKSDKRIGLIYPNSYIEIDKACRSAASQNQTVESLPITPNPLPFEFGQASALSKRVDVVIAFTENADANTDLQKLINVLPPERTVVVALQSPFDLRVFPNVAGYLLAYDPVDDAFRAACATMFGKQSSQGMLPVALSNKLTTGWGIILKPASDSK